MAERRMFAKSVIGTDDFIDMPPSAKVLYFYLMTEADDDGFVDHPKAIMRYIGATQDDIKILLGKQYCLAFDNGLLVIRHWKVHNYIRKDMYKPTKHLTERNQLVINEGVYDFVTDSLQNCNEPVTELSQTCLETVSLGKDRLGKDRLGKDRLGKDSIAAATRARAAVDNSQPVDNSRDEVMTAFSNNIHPITGEIELQKLTDLEQHYGRDWMLAAIQEAAENHGHSVRYIESILTRWERDGFRTHSRSRQGTGTGNPQADIAARAIAMLEEQERNEQIN